jgi:hypothetical protein
MMNATHLRLMADDLWDREYTTEKASNSAPWPSAATKGNTRRMTASARPSSTPSEG